METNNIVRVEVGNVYKSKKKSESKWYDDSKYYLVFKKENGFFFFAECYAYDSFAKKDEEFKLHPLPFGTSDPEGNRIYYTFEDCSKFEFVKNTNECFLVKSKYSL